MRKTRVLAGVAAVALMFFAAEVAVDASGGSRPSGSSGRGDKMAKYYNEGVEAVKAKDYEKALKLFKKAKREDKKHPDALNMLAFTQRKLGKLDDAFENYEKALKYRKHFPQAREYLAEAHLQAALQQLQILQSYGTEADNERLLFMESLKRALDMLNADGTFKEGAEFASGDW